jgi:hypothetical protein
VNPIETAKILRQQRARGNQRRGEDAQQVARLRLIGMGMSLVEMVATPTKARYAGGKLIGLKYTSKVSGDIRAVLPPLGKSVLCEVKQRPERLVFSDLYPHQVDALDTHAAAGGLSLLAWMHLGGLEIMPWPVPGFRSGDAMTPQHAALFRFSI